MMRRRSRLARRFFVFLYRLITHARFRRLSLAIGRRVPSARILLIPIMHRLYESVYAHAPLELPGTELRGERPRLLIDVSTTYNMGQVSGIQRTVRSLAGALQDHSDRYAFEPVPVRMAWQNNRLVLLSARSFPEPTAHPETIAIRPGDVLFMLDSSWDIYHFFVDIFPMIRRGGGKIVTCVFDVLPITNPRYFTAELGKMFDGWFWQAARESDLILSISKATMDEVERIAPRIRRSDFFHLGADFASTDIQTTASNRRPKTFLVVGTIEPRKGHETILDAFEALWKINTDVDLIVVGKAGWLVDELIARMEAVASRNSRFHFYGYVSDAVLSEIFGMSDVVISASLAEGFGLPVVEALRLGKPVIASDIPAFREVAGDMPVYFRTGDADSLMVAVQHIIEQGFIQEAAVPSWLTWRESADSLMEKIGALMEKSECVPRVTSGNDPAYKGRQDA